MKALPSAREELEKWQGSLRRMRRVGAGAIACALALPALAHAVGIPVPEARLQVQAVDAKSGKKIGPAWVAAHESYYWTLPGVVHSASGTECFRAVTALLDAARSDPIVLPSASVDPVRWPRSVRHIELLAYSPGYCVARPYEQASMAGFIKWANEKNPSGLWGSVASPEPGKEIAIRMVAASDPPEHRLRHLKATAREIAGSCFQQGRGYLEPMKKAMLVEANRLAVTPLEKFLVTQIGQEFDDRDAPRKTLFLPFQGLASSGDVKMLRMLLDQRRKDPTLRAEIMIPSGSSNVSNKVMRLSPGGPNHVPLNPTLDINDRNEMGLTPLMEGARAMQPATVKMLLDDGADVNVVSSPGGYSALDLVLSRAADDVRESGTEGQEIHLLRMLDLLTAARPAPTIHPGYRAELEDTGRWAVTPHLRDFFLQVRQRVSALRAREAVATICPIERVARPSLGIRGGNTPDT